MEEKLTVRCGSYKRSRKEEARQSTVNFITSNKSFWERLGRSADDITGANKTWREGWRRVRAMYREENSIAALYRNLWKTCGTRKRFKFLVRGLF